MLHRRLCNDRAAAQSGAQNRRLTHGRFLGEIRVREDITVSDWDRDTTSQHLDQVMNEQVVPRPRHIEFEALAADVILANRGLTQEEIADGLVGGTRDGALDCVYVFVNSVLVREDSDLLRPGSGRQLDRPTIRVELIQAKESNGFSENAIVLAASHVDVLLNVDRDDVALEGHYSDEVLDATRRFLTVHSNLRLSQPTLEIAFSYVAVADEAQINPAVETELRNFETKVASRVFGATVEARTRGVESIVRYLRRRPSYDGDLITDELMPQQRPGEVASWVTLVSLRNYIAFLTDDDGSYRDYLFTDNVRDYNPSSPVNRDIVRTLLDPASPEFWWLNNGVTVVCASVYAPGKSLSVKDIQIVNGLQTSQSIWDTLKDVDPSSALLDRCVLVRVIPTPDKKVRDLVIRATNSQTPVKIEGLRATSAVQLEIEEILLSAGYFYDRRRNFYKNQGKPKARIVSIRELAQQLLTWVALRPDEARARPADYLKSDNRHDQLFSTSLPKPIFAWVLEAQEVVDRYLVGKADLDAAQRNDLRFVLASVIAVGIATTRSRIADQLVAAGAPETLITKRRLDLAFRKVVDAIASAQKEDAKIQRDQVVKSRQFVESVLGTGRHHATVKKGQNDSGS